MHRLSGDKAQMRPDTFRAAAACRRAASIGRAAAALAAARCARCLWRALCNTNTECQFPLLPFLVKVKILFRFFSVTKPGTNYRRSFIKVKWHNTDFQKVRDTCNFKMNFINGSVQPNLWKFSFISQKTKLTNCYVISMYINIKQIFFLTVILGCSSSASIQNEFWNS